MSLEIILFVTSLGLSFLFNHLFNIYFLKKNKIDEINTRSSHTVAATKTGGIAIFIGLFFISSVLYILNKELYDFSLLLPLGIMFITGVYDDFYNANFKLKFFLQVIVAKLFIDQGFIISNFHGFLGFYEVHYIIAQLSTIVVFLIIVNAINFIDGIDGLAPSLIILALIFTEWIKINKSELFHLNQIALSLLIPFYYFNSRRKNKVFLGDAGSLFFGSLIAINIFSFLDSSLLKDMYYNPTLASICILFYPLVDLLRVFILRVKKGQSPFIADKNHLHHRLVVISKNHYIRSLIIVLFSGLFFAIVLVLELNFKSLYSVIFLLITTLFILRIK